ncbi:MAG: GGDEF domain-containing protein, partial [Rhizorhabdus sp.]|uniref:GGDEF domain-containing protein n=1 Tax=Rhizorhabdus sp. TaxID=1968843 RepID=UPI001B4CABD5
MRAAKTHNEQATKVVDGGAAQPGAMFPVALQELLDTPRTAAQQEFIDTLPIAIALLCLVEGNPSILARNRAFLDLAGRRASPPATDGAREICPGIGLPLVPEIRDFLASDERERTFDMQEGDGISGRHFAVRLVRLSGGESPVPRCILSLIDRTQQVEGERSLRTQMLRDSLTGLPNRAAFAEQVENAMLNFGTEGRQFAVLLIDLTR